MPQSGMAGHGPATSSASARPSASPCLSGSLPACLSLALALLPWLLLLSPAQAMRPARMAELRQDTVAMFYHGFSNYMHIAFPEDELRPVSCSPLTRDPLNPRNHELNDVLGNYSLTLIDSLSTLAILASAPPDANHTALTALADFQNGIAALVAQYGDGSPGPRGHGARSRGFDVDSKVQVFETVIRGVGGLLSAHLFAVGDLPINGYHPPAVHDDLERHPIPWANGFKYDGQLLRLALDLAQRLLPAFYTMTGMPYPRVNLRHGIPFYWRSPLHDNDDPDPHAAEGPAEITETCSAGAGSLVLEFTVLSRLTGDPRFEQAAKRAFWAVWSRRSNIGLIGAGVDAEEGHWIGGYSGIGAGIDSFFEYALKTHILLSGHDLPNRTMPARDPASGWLDPNEIYVPLSDRDNSPETFLQAWHHAHASIKRHLYSGSHHPHYINVHVATGSPQAYWIDSLGAYYSGLLTLAGELDEAIETHLLYTALWTRYSALPERWSVRDGTIEGGLGWWPGRPEFIESTYHLYRASKDPWYLYVGEMVLKDITRRCKTACGWSGLQDVRTGEKSDRMESFFLGETAKYLYLLYDTNHPLNKLDAAYVFTTEGHPLIIPRRKTPEKPARKPAAPYEVSPYYDPHFTNSCPNPPKLPPLTGSATAARPDLYNAAKLIRLHQIPNIHGGSHGPVQLLSGQGTQAQPSLNHAVDSNHTKFPWTLPSSMLPADGVCVVSKQATSTVIEFPSKAQQTVGNTLSQLFGGQNVFRTGNDGVVISSLSGLRMAMTVEEPPEYEERGWRITALGTLPLGRDEKVYVGRDVLADISDPLFHRVRNAVLADIVVQSEITPTPMTPQDNATQQKNASAEEPKPSAEPQTTAGVSAEEPNPSITSLFFSSLLQHLTSALREPVATFSPEPGPSVEYSYMDVDGITPVGIGAAPLPDAREAPSLHALETQPETLHWRSVYMAGTACDGRLPNPVPREHHVIIMRRGGCSFSEKLMNVPPFVPHRNALQLVIIVSDDDHDSSAQSEGAHASHRGHENPDEDSYGASLGEEDWSDDLPPEYAQDDQHEEEVSLMRPLLDEQQRTPSGIVRPHPIPMLMVGGGADMYEKLGRARSIGLRRRYHVESQGLKIGNLVVL